MAHPPPLQASPTSQGNTNAYARSARKRRRVDSPQSSPATKSGSSGKSAKAVKALLSPARRPSTLRLETLLPAWTASGESRKALGEAASQLEQRCAVAGAQASVEGACSAIGARIHALVDQLCPAAPGGATPKIDIIWVGDIGKINGEHEGALKNQDDGVVVLYSALRRIQLFCRGTFQFLHRGKAHNLGPWADALAGHVHQKEQLPAARDLPALGEAWCGLLLFPPKRHDEKEGISSKLAHHVQLIPRHRPLHPDYGSVAVRVVAAGGAAATPNAAHATHATTANHPAAMQVNSVCLAGEVPNCYRTGNVYTVVVANNQTTQQRLASLVDMLKADTAGDVAMLTDVRTLAAKPGVDPTQWRSIIANAKAFPKDGSFTHLRTCRTADPALRMRCLRMLLYLDNDSALVAEELLDSAAFAEAYRTFGPRCTMASAEAAARGASTAGGSGATASCPDVAQLLSALPQVTHAQLRADQAALQKRQIDGLFELQAKHGREQSAEAIVNALKSRHVLPAPKTKGKGKGKGKGVDKEQGGLQLERPMTTSQIDDMAADLEQCSAAYSQRNTTSSDMLADWMHTLPEFVATFGAVAGSQAGARGTSSSATGGSGGVPMRRTSTADRALNSLLAGGDGKGKGRSAASHRRGRHGSISAVPVETILANFDPSGKPKRSAGAASLVRYASMESVGSSSTGGVPCSSGVDEKSMSSPIASSSSGYARGMRRTSSGDGMERRAAHAHVSWRAHQETGRSARFPDVLQVHSHGIDYCREVRQRPWHLLGPALSYARANLGAWLTPPLQHCAGCRPAAPRHAVPRRTASFATRVHGRAAPCAWRLRRLCAVQRGCAQDNDGGHDAQAQLKRIKRHIPWENRPAWCAPQDKSRKRSSLAQLETISSPGTGPGSGRATPTGRITPTVEPRVEESKEIITMDESSMDALAFQQQDLGDDDDDGTSPKSSRGKPADVSDAQRDKILQYDAAQKYSDGDADAGVGVGARSGFGMRARQDTRSGSAGDDEDDASAGQLRRERDALKAENDTLRRQHEEETRDLRAKIRQLTTDLEGANAKLKSYADVTSALASIER